MDEESQDEFWENRERLARLESQVCYGWYALMLAALAIMFLGRDSGIEWIFVAAGASIVGFAQYRVNGIKADASHIRYGMETLYSEVEHLEGQLEYHSS